MRLWHKDLIEYLPRQQLLGQWRECCLIAKNIVEKGSPNHILVNPIMDYPISHFLTYALMVQTECGNRGYKIKPYSFWRYFPDTTWILPLKEKNIHRKLAAKDIFWSWHTDRYLRQCIMNLQEKFDRGGISNEEFDPIWRFYQSIETDKFREQLRRSRRC